MDKSVYRKALASIKVMEDKYQHLRKYCQNLSIVGSKGSHKLTGTACASDLRSSQRIQLYADKFGGTVEAITSMTSIDYKQSYYNKVENPEDYTNFFFSWLLWRSPYSPCIVTKKVKYAVEHGIVYDTHYPNNLIVGAITASRCAWEHSELMASMYYLVQAGMNESAAFYIAHLVKCTAKYTVTTSGSDCHAALAEGKLTFEGLKNFCAGKMIVKGRDYANSLTYMDIQVAWGGKEGRRLTLPSLISEAKVAGKKAHLPNPFERSLDLNATIKLSGLDDVKKLCEYVNKFIEDVE